MRKIIQIIANEKGLYALTEDGKVYLAKKVLTDEQSANFMSEQYANTMWVELNYPIMK